jgi:hypothetical protein
MRHNARWGGYPATSRSAISDEPALPEMQKDADDNYGESAEHPAARRGE